MARFSSEHQPSVRKGRGISERVKILAAMKRIKMTEDDFYDQLLSRALDRSDSFALKELLSRFSPTKKATLPDVEFDFNSSGTPVEQVAQILTAISCGEIPPDVGTQIITAIRSAIDIEVNTEIKDRIAKIEEAMRS
jgi:hypothetical protein